MSPTKKRLVLFLFAGFSLLQIGMSLSRGELFPFSWHGIYFGLVSGKDAKLASVFLVDGSGRESRYEDWVKIKGTSRYIHHLNDLVLDSKDVFDHLAQVKKIAEALREPAITALNASPEAPAFHSLRVYAEEWDHFEGPRLNFPDERQLLCEVALAE